ncbi:MAG TPA: ribosome small subunit-dependent GTPase A [Chitinophagaceae bacterium]|nr:ribosome small subunit-dependent GTPase A [Chitinophagaceae bacterium]
MRARVYKSTGSWYSVKTEDGNFSIARIKGIFKIDGITSTNPVAVGDWVNIEIEVGGEEGGMMITGISERNNYINRQSPANKHQHHIIASNLDQSLLLATLKDPKTSQGFIDRFLVAGEAFHIPSVVVFNKADIYRKKEMDLYEERKDMYEAAGYKVVLMSIENRTGMEEVDEILRDKTSLLSGHSGVGKSSFINMVVPGMGLKTQDVSGWSGKGIHTTTFAEMYDLPLLNAHIIDTPGIREFGLVDIPRQELSHYFPEMRSRLNDCQFNNCLHVNEPGCAIKKALNEGKLSFNRYVSYCMMLDSIEEKTY